MNWLLQQRLVAFSGGGEKQFVIKKLHETKTYKAPCCNIPKLLGDRKKWKLIYASPPV